MKKKKFINYCIKNVFDGLIEGLSFFSKPSRVAVIYAINSDDDFHIYDPMGLLSGHDLKLRELFIDSCTIQNDKKSMELIHSMSYILPEENLQLAGLISFGGRYRSISYQMWFTDHHPDICSTVPIERWIEQACWLLSQDIEEKQQISVSAAHVLRNYSIHAIHDCIVDERNIIMGWDTKIRIYPILDAILEIARTPEEGSWPRGELVFAEKSDFDQIEFITRFIEHERPFLHNHKHTRKLLQTVEDSDRKLISDGVSIIGIARGKMPNSSLTAFFKGDHGFLKMSSKIICSFSDRSFSALTRTAKLFEVEEILLDTDLSLDLQRKLFNLISVLVRYAESRNDGCSLVVDLNDKAVTISGQQLIPTINLSNYNMLRLAESLIKIDGALHITKNLELLSFGCLLDGLSIPGENRARGARFNSALRFSAIHDNLFIVVVSSDKNVSIIKDGIELSAQCIWKPLTGYISTPPLLKDVI